MKKPVRMALMVLGVAVLAGCQSSTVFGTRTGRSQRTPSYNAYQGPMGETPSDYGYEGGWETASGGSVPSRVGSAAREATRKAGLEAQVARLQSQVDALSAAQEGVVAQANATISRSNASQDSVRTELDALRMEIVALKAENKALREEQASQRAQIAALPSKITTAITAAMPKQSAPTRSSSSSSGGSRGGSRECYEHVVASGDTVSAIAAAYHVTTSDIVRENNLKDAGAIRVGQTLYIPKK